MTLLIALSSIAMCASTFAIPHAPEPQAVEPTHDSVRTALDDEARFSLSQGHSPRQLLCIDVVMPVQIESDDVTYWSWVLALDASTESRLREGVRAGQKADDQLRKRMLIPLFLLAEQVSTPPDIFSQLDAPALSRALVASRSRALIELRSAERAMIERSLTDVALTPLETLTAERLDGLRQQDLAAEQFETLQTARVDVGRFLYLVSKGVFRVNLCADSIEIARQCLVDAQPMLTQLRRLHDASFAKCLETGSRLLSVAALRAREVAMDAATTREWKHRNERARRPLATASRRIAEANLALIDLICAAIPDDEGKRL